MNSEGFKYLEEEFEELWGKYGRTIPWRTAEGWDVVQFVTHLPEWDDVEGARRPGLFMCLKEEECFCDEWTGVFWIEDDGAAYEFRREDLIHDATFI